MLFPKTLNNSLPLNEIIGCTMDTKAKSKSNMPSVSDTLKSSRLTIASIPTDDATDTSVNADIGCGHRAFLDSSGRARTRIGVKIHNDDDDGNNESLKHVLDQWRRNLSFEASVSQSSVTVAVEGIRIVSCTCSEDEADGYLCILEIVMRVVNDLVTSVLARNMHKGVINVTFQLSALFVVCGSSGKSDEEEKTFVDPLAELRRETSMIFASSSERDDAVSNYSVGAVVRTKYTSLSIQLMEAFKVTCHSIPASRAAWGATLISVTITHPNTHSHKVVISGISLHPGHARPVVFRNQKQIETSEQMMEYARSITLPAEISGDNRCMQGGNGVINMTGHVRWCYAAGTALDLPLTLETNEAYSTILQVDATDDVNSRYFMSPVAVTGTVLFEKSNCESSQQKQSLPLIVSTYASWTTSRVAVSPSNAFRVDLTLFEKSFRVGTPFTVSHCDAYIHVMIIDQFEVYILS